MQINISLLLLFKYKIDPQCYTLTLMLHVVGAGCRFDSCLPAKAELLFTLLTTLKVSCGKTAALPHVAQVIFTLLTV